MRVVILEDEQPALAHLQALVTEQLSEMRQLTCFSDVASAEAHLLKQPTDLLFLDLDLNDASGFSILERLQQRSFHTIIVSGHIDQALRAFELDVLDFIAKPASAQALERALGKMRRLEQSSVRMIGVESKSEVQLLQIEDVLYIERNGHQSVYVCRNDRRYSSRQSLAELLKGLPGQFSQAHKSFIVNLGCIQQLNSESGGRYEALLVNGETLPVGRSHYRELRERLGV